MKRGGRKNDQHAYPRGLVLDMILALIKEPRPVLHLEELYKDLPDSDDTMAKKVLLEEEKRVLLLDEDKKEVLLLEEKKKVLLLEEEKMGLLLEEEKRMLLRRRRPPTWRENNPYHGCPSSFY